MLNKFQQLVNKLLLDNMNIVGDVLMSGGEATGNVVTDPNIKVAMAISGGGLKNKKRKRKKKKHIFRRNLTRQL